MSRIIKPGEEHEFDEQAQLDAHLPRELVDSCIGKRATSLKPSDFPVKDSINLKDTDWLHEAIQAIDDLMYLRRQQDAVLSRLAGFYRKSYSRLTDQQKAYFDSVEKNLAVESDYRIDDLIDE